MKWEYHVGYFGRVGASSDGTASLERYLNERGQKGWELSVLVEADKGHWVIVLKRQVPL